jgi:hypothetical protein
MIGNLEPEERVLSASSKLSNISMPLKQAIDILGWDELDDIRVEIGGCATSGIHQKEDANPKWARQFGDTVYNKDAFIVIKNRSRD